MALTKITRAILDTGVSDSSDATAITIDSSENVGIGVTSIDSKLQIANADGSTYRFGYGGTSDVYFDADSVRFRTDNGGSGTATIDTDGLKFNNDTAAANALDDYEEGIHVATITCGTSGTVSLNGAYSDLSYTKIGRVVTVSGLIIVSSVSSPVGYYTISLPYTCANLTDRAADSNASIHHHYGNNAKPADIVAFLPESSSQLHVYRGDVSTTRSETSAEELRASTQIVFSITYTVA
tara:strand:+ start:3298 stop:4011 length:714 start_codon:yes stop_codon:yes gene_type:complete